MTQTTSDQLTVPGSSLYYEVRGSGPALLLIHGGGGDAGGLERVATALAAHRTVIIYDQRGYGRSRLTAQAEGSPSIGTHADDAAHLIETLTDGTAEVFGSSSGAIIALDLFTRRPELVSTAVLHEPPLVSLLPDAAARKAFFDEVYATYRSDGLEAGMQKHLSAIGMTVMSPPPNAQLPPHLVDLLARMPANQEFFLANQIRQIPGYEPDLDTLRTLPRLAQRLILAGGADSHEQYPYWPNQVLAERLGLSVIDFVGDHIGYLMHPAEFAVQLLAVLPQSRRG